MSYQTLADVTVINIIKDKIGVEGAYTNIPADPGGATKYGVTQRVANQYADALKQQFGWSGDVKDFTQEMAIYVYQHEFITPMKIDQICAIAPIIADKVFDIGINAGPTEGIQFMQRALNIMNNKATLYPDVATDGANGPGTLGALQAFVNKRGQHGIWVLAVVIGGFQTAFYEVKGVKNPNLEMFEFGWGDRVARDHALYARLHNIQV